MSCYNSNNYLPQPPRVWSRVQNRCDVDSNDYTIVHASVLREKHAMLNKGNVLQYKANSSNLTAAQRYSKIAKGQWVNRNTTWASQSTRGYTNPNTTSLKRYGNVVNIAVDPITGTVIGPTTNPPTCPQQFIPVYPALPSNVGGSSDPDIPPPVEPTPASNTFPAIIPESPVEPDVMQDGGSLICSIQENICTGEITKRISQQLCYPTTASDVPGTIQDLCWDDGTPTWYPRSRYIMTNSTNKWPVNAKLSSAIIIYPPVITSISTEDTDIATLTWTHNSGGLPSTRFAIFNNTTLVKSVDGNTFTTSIPINIFSINRIYMFSQIGYIVSERSNIVNINDNADSGGNVVAKNNTQIWYDGKWNSKEFKQTLAFEYIQQDKVIDTYLHLSPNFRSHKLNSHISHIYSNIVLKPSLEPAPFVVPLRKHMVTIHKPPLLSTVSNLETILIKLYNCVGKDLLTFTNKYSLGLTEELSDKYTYDVYSKLVQSVFNCSFISSTGYTKLREIVMDSIEGLRQNILQTNTYKTELSTLQNIISQLKSETQPHVLNEQITLNIIAEIRPEIIKYINKYGFPSGGVFDTTLLGEIMGQLQNNTSIKVND